MTDMIWDPTYECMPREDLEKLQLKRLKATIHRAYEKVPCYKNKFDELKIQPEDIQSLQDFQKLPFTTKEDLRINYPYGMFAVPLREVVRIHSSSGTTGKPIVVGYTKNDIKTWSNLVARFMTAAGVTDEDVVQIAFGYGMFTGAFGLHYGAETIRASVIPMSGGHTDRQIMIMQDYKSSALVCTPSYAITLADRIKKMGINPKDLSLKVGLFGGEPWTEAMRQEIQAGLNIIATDNYGLSEVTGPGVAGECQHLSGMHISEDAFIPEIIDPDSGEVLPPGRMGELVLTTLTKEALPVIRYRTRDITSLNYEKCQCGRTTIRMEKTTGRTDDMLIIRGVNVFPSQIEEALIAIEGCEPHYLLVIDRQDSLDTLEIQMEVTENIFFDEMKKQKSFLEIVKKRVESIIGVSVIVKLVEPGSIKRYEGKAERVVDKRKLG
ncbi:MAG: phenylacetate--CoA ligase [Desulfuromonadales bacterium]|nr:phenylacetate--CoA ligase [Desulfuromonadales bacterium]